jgi:hypothetical protein
MKGLSVIFLTLVFFPRLTPIGPHEDVDRRLSLALSQDATVDRRKLLTTLDDQCRHLTTAMNEQKRLEVVRKAVGLFGHFLTDPRNGYPVSFRISPDTHSIPQTRKATPTLSCP